MRPAPSVVRRSRARPAGVRLARTTVVSSLHVLSGGGAALGPPAYEVVCQQKKWTLGPRAVWTGSRTTGSVRLRLELERVVDDGRAEDRLPARSRPDRLQLEANRRGERQHGHGQRGALSLHLHVSQPGRAGLGRERLDAVGQQLPVLVLELRARRVGRPARLAATRRK